MGPSGVQKIVSYSADFTFHFSFAMNLSVRYLDRSANRHAAIRADAKNAKGLTVGDASFDVAGMARCGWQKLMGVCRFGAQVCR